MIFIIIIYIIQGVIFGFAVDSVITNKGYKDNWFWLGFFFGFFALIVALSKPEVTHVHYSESLLLQKAQKEHILDTGGWKCCFCHSINAFNVTSCSCGMSKDESERRMREKQQAAASSDAFAQSEAETIELIGQYKKLLDSGALTQQEFDAKKQALLSSATHRS